MLLCAHCRPRHGSRSRWGDGERAWPVARGGDPCPGAAGVNAGVGAMGADVVLVAQSEPSARLKINPAAKRRARHSVSMGAIAMAVRRIVQTWAVARISEAVGMRADR